MEIRHRLRLEEREEYRESLALYRKPEPCLLSNENRGSNPPSLTLRASLSIEKQSILISSEKPALSQSNLTNLTRLT
jgi:hypothetical protein